MALLYPLPPIYPFPRCALNLPASDELIHLLLDPLDTRPRDRVARGGNITVRISYPRTPPKDDVDDETVDFPEEHMMTLDHELRWIPAAPVSLSPFRPVVFKEPTKRQMRTQTTDIDRTTKWDWADLRQSRIRKSLGRNKRGLARAKSVEEMAVDRLDMREALKECTPGELRALRLTFAGWALNSSARVQKMRALRKSSELRKRNARCVPIVNEGPFRKTKKEVVYDRARDRDPSSCGVYPND